ncbi:MAG TPA: substrate-binding domain-containing protein [Verrucomicrobiae bacterium]|jgi:LacI family transcriptional regulator|nr:substrate-binding domain-containing protein [Verrucomicrobiae bacterium]
MKKSQKRVLVALGWYDYRLHRGIEKFALEHNWHLSANLARERVIPWGWEGNGILAWLGAGDDLADFVAHAAKPTVDFSFRRPQMKYARVLEDHAHAAQLVAEHFLSRGFHNFMFYSDTDNWSYEERGAGFNEALKRSGHACTWLRWHQSPEFRDNRDQWKRKRKWLIAQLKPLAKPLAVFAASDEQALEVLESCESAGLMVPEEVAIVGAENNLLAPDAMLTPISSVDTNLGTLGYTGAAMLEDLMNGKKAQEKPVRVPASGVVTRKSSDLLAVKHKGVANSLRFILEHASQPISVKDLVGVAAMSRRGLHKAFLENVGRTPGQELRRVRIERAKRLLAESNHKLEVLAGMCGYQSANSFCVAFKQATGMPPKQFQDGVVH